MGLLLNIETGVESLNIKTPAEKFILTRMNIAIATNRKFVSDIVPDQPVNLASFDANLEKIRQDTQVG